MSRLRVRLALVAVVASVMAVSLQAEHVYKKAAAVNDLMAYMVKPAMDQIKVFREAGGPADKDQWQTAYGAISMVTEAAQLVLMDGRVKDDAWSDGAEQVIEAARSAMLGAYRMDANGYSSSIRQMQAGCKTCHDVHKKDKE